MGSVDFTEWAEPNLDLTLGGKHYLVPPPSVDQAKQILACAVAFETATGLSKAALPDDVRATVARLADTPIADLTLGAGVTAQLAADGASQLTINRMGYYGMFFWARGKARADAIALELWTEREEVEDSAPKARRRSRSTSGRSTA